MSSDIMEVPQVVEDIESHTCRAWFQAADNGSVDDLKRLLRLHPCLLHYRDRFENLKASTALHVCVWKNHTDAADLLLQRGADVDALDESGMTPLQIDILRVYVEQMQPTPIRRSRCIDVNSPVPLTRLERPRVRDRTHYDQIDTSTLEVLLRYHANVNKCSQIGQSALHMTVDSGMTKHVLLLLKHGADVYSKDTMGRTVLDIVAEHGYRDLIELFMKRYPNLLQIAGEQALHRSICHDVVTSLELLYNIVLATKEDEDSRVIMNGQLLHKAIEHDATECTTFLLDFVMDKDWRNTDGETAVHAACRHNRPVLLEMLLQRGVNGNLCTAHTRFSAYHIAVTRYGIAEIEILAQYGVNINLIDHEDNTPLLYAATHGYSFELMACLIRQGARFTFANSLARDKITPILVQWVYEVAPLSVPALVNTLLVHGCFADENEQVRCVLSSLVWSQHAEEGLLFTFLILFRSKAEACLQARTLIIEWLTKYQANVTTIQLVHDVLQR